MGGQRRTGRQITGRQAEEYRQEEEDRQAEADR